MQNRFFIAVFYITTIALQLCVTTASAQKNTDTSPERIASAIHDQLLEFKPALTPLRGYVVAVRNGNVYIENKSGAIVKAGSVLSVFRETEAIIHPVTGEKLGAIKEKISMLKTISSDSKLLVAEPEPGQKEVKPGDVVGDITAGKPKVAVARLISVPSADVTGIMEHLFRKLSSWGESSFISPYAVERFLYDRNITGAMALSDPALRDAMSRALKADYLILIELKEKNGTILSDVSLSDLKKGTMLATGKGLIGKVEQGSMAAKKTAPPKFKTPATKPFKKTANITGTLAKFDRQVSALLSCDLDNDGENEILIGFERKVGVYKINGKKLEKIWETDLGSRSQVTGLAAGDFNGNGAVEVYVNGLKGDTISSMIFERDRDGAFGIVLEKAGYHFYAGDDGKLYGQRQSVDTSLDEKIYALQWAGSKLIPSPFITLPEDMRLSGLMFSDIDGDGRTDVAGYDYEYGMEHYSSRTGKWNGINERFGGSNIKLPIPTPGDSYVAHDFQPPILPMPESVDGFNNLVLVHNHPAISYMVDSPSFDKSQLYVMEYDGVNYFKKARTPLADGVIHGISLFNKNLPALVIVSVTQSGFFEKTKSKIVLIDLNRY